MATHLVTFLSQIGWVRVPEPARSLFPYSIFHVPYSIFHIPYSIFHIPCSMFHMGPWGPWGPGPRRLPVGSRHSLNRGGPGLGIQRNSFRILNGIRNERN